ncbi:MAG: ferrous iron transport protein B [Anaerolineaceae bacterium]|nr:ferrous iron transport protein B [Anaerolineaceae bacterium]
MREQYRIALAGNPNCGKTTIFNQLTGMHQHVGNWPGKTVEQKTGTCRYGSMNLEIIDLPGTYSLSAYSQEEIIARDFIVHEKPDVVICVLDATSLERNLYLTAQILELNVPVVITLNMADMLLSTGMKIDTLKLSKALQAPIIYTAANRAEGIDELIQTAIMVADQTSGRPLPEFHPHDAFRPAGRGRRGFRQHGRMRGFSKWDQNMKEPRQWHFHHHIWKLRSRGMDRNLNRHARQHSLAYTHPQSFMVDYGREVEHEIVKISHVLENYPTLEAEFPTRWLAIKLLEQDDEVAEHIREVEDYQAIFNTANLSLAHLRRVYGDGVDTIIADRRYGWINGLVHEVVVRSNLSRQHLSDQIDKLVTHRISGFIIFFFLMWGVFKISTDIAGPYSDWIAGFFYGPLTKWTLTILDALNLSDLWFESFLLDGVIAGVGGVLVFVPVLFFLYMALAILEDSGYMARAAFLMDKIMHMLGLHGKSFLPMILGFGCTVPALYGTRTLKNQHDRVLVGMLLPFISCSAKIPVYVIISTIFFPENPGIIIFLLYVIGVLTAFGVGLLLKNTIFRNKKESPFVMELPPYRMPTLKSIWLHTWERTSAFIQKAWTVILIASLIIWFLFSLPVGSTQAGFAEVDVEDSAFAVVSQAIVPILKPTGFGSWENAGALISGVFGKEIIVSTYSQIFNVNRVVIEEETKTTFFQDAGQLLVGFWQSTGDTIKSIPLIVGINLFEDVDEDEFSSSNALYHNLNQTSGGHARLAAFSLLIFILYYTPCLISLNAEWQEMGWKPTLMTAFEQLGMAWLASTLIFQLGVLFGIG